MAAVKEKKKPVGVPKNEEEFVLRTIKLADIVDNTGQTRFFGGAAPVLKQLGYGLFEKESVDKNPIWSDLFSDDPAVRKRMAALIRENEPDIVAQADSQEINKQVSPIRVLELADGKYDVASGMTRCLARALNHIENPKLPDTVQAIVISKKPKLELLFTGYADNNDRRGEGPISKALFFKMLTKEEKMTPPEIGKRVGWTDQNVRNYLKLLHPKLEDKQDDIENGRLSVDKALKRLVKLVKAEKEGEDAEEDNGRDSSNRARMHSVGKLDKIYDAKQKPEDIEQKEWEMMVKDDVRRWLAFRLKKKFKPFTGEVLTEEKKPEKKEKTASPGVKLAIPTKKAVRLLVALGKTEAENWEPAVIISKLENIVALVEEGTTLEDESLDALLQKLIDGYAKGITVTLK